MTIIEALKTGLPIKRRGRVGWRLRYSDPFCQRDSYGWGWFDPDYFLSVVELAKEDILAKDWQVKKRAIKK